MSFGESSRIEFPLSRCVYTGSFVSRYGGVYGIDRYGKSDVGNFGGVLRFLVV